MRFVAESGLALPFKLGVLLHKGLELLRSQQPVELLVHPFVSRCTAHVLVAKARCILGSGSLASDSFYLSISTTTSV